MFYPPTKATTMDAYEAICLVCLCTHVNLHPLDRERLDLRHLVRHEPVELVPSLVPLDGVEVVAAQVVRASQVGSLAALQVLRQLRAAAGG